MSSNYIDTLIDQFAEDGEADKEYRHPVHGRIVETRFEPYHDVTVYEDGYEERFYIGE